MVDSSHCADEVVFFRAILIDVVNLRTRAKGITIVRLRSVCQTYFGCRIRRRSRPEVCSLCSAQWAGNHISSLDVVSQ
jgi:hypothetical protein